MCGLIDESNPPVIRTENDSVPIEFGRLSPYARHYQPVVITADETPDPFSEPRVLLRVSAMLDKPKYRGGKRIKRKLPRVSHAQFG
jgi:hypothetical protein